MKNPRPLKQTGQPKPRREITVMFVDIARLPDLARKTDIMAAQRIFNEAVINQINICNKFSGIVNKLTVNGLMCLFGTEGEEDHALKAFLAAEEMIENGKTLQAKLRRTLFDVRIGINTGDVVLRPAQGESDRGARYQVAGEAVQVAENILQVAKPDTIVVSEASKKHLQSLFSFRRFADIVRTKNNTSVPLFQKSSQKVIDIVPPVESFGALVRVHERDGVLAHIRSSLKNRKPNITWIEGASGYGKTYLADYAVSASGDVFRNVIRIHFFPQPLPEGKNRFEVGILQSILPQDDEKLKSLILRSAIYEELKSVELIYNCICDTVGKRYAVSSGYAFLSSIQKANLRRRIITSLLIEVAGANGTLLVLEDMHWADEMELGYIEDIIESPVPAGGNLHLLCTSRQKPPAAIARHEGLEVVRFEALSDQQSLALISSKSFGIRLPETVAEKVCGLAGGNPYFIQGYLDWIRDRRKAGRTYQDILAESEQGAPVKVANILYSKLNELSKEAIAIAKLASVQGMTINAELLARMSNLFRDDVLLHLARLEEANIICSQIQRDGQTWTFVHELLQKAIYNSIPKQARADLHAAIVRVVRQSVGRYRHPYQLLQYHAVLAGDDRCAYVYSKWAAKEAMHASLHGASIQYLNAAQKALSRLQGGFDPKKHRTLLEFMKLKSFFVLSRYKDAKRTIGKLLKDKKRLLALNIFRETLSFEGVCLWINGDIASAEKTFRALFDLSGGAGVRLSHIREAQRLCNICIDLGNYKDAVAYGQQALKILHEEESHQTLGLLVEIRPAVYSCLSLAFAKLGDIGKSLHYLRDAQKFLKDSNDYMTKAYACVFIGRTLMHFGRYEEAVSLLGDALGYCDFAQSDLLKPYILGAHGLALAHMGRVKEGEKRGLEALKMAKDTGARIWLSALQVWHAEVLMMRDNLIMAERYLQRAADNAEKTGAEGWLEQAAALLTACKQKKAARA